MITNTAQAADWGEKSGAKSSIFNDFIKYRGGAAAGGFGTPP
jgi:hypothetical protein